MRIQYSNLYSLGELQIEHNVASVYPLPGRHDVPRLQPAHVKGTKCPRSVVQISWYTQNIKMDKAL